MAASQRSAAAGRTPAPLPWRRRSRPTAATSTPTSTASIPPTRASSRARKLDYVTYEEMLELASVGAKVLQTRSVGLAMKMGVRVQVPSSFVEGDEAPAKGTMIVSDEEIEKRTKERRE